MSLTTPLDFTLTEKPRDNEPLPALFERLAAALKNLRAETDSLRAETPEQKAATLAYQQAVVAKNNALKNAADLGKHLDKLTYEIETQYGPDALDAHAGLRKARENHDRAQDELATAENQLAEAEKTVQFSTDTLARLTAKAQTIAKELAQLTAPRHPSDGATPGLETTPPYLRNSINGRVASMIENGMIDFHGARTGPPLVEVVQNLTPQQRADLGQYLLAKRALAIWNDTKQPGRDPSIPKAEAEKTIATHETPDFIHRARLFYQWHQGLLDYGATASEAMALGRYKIETADPGYYAPLWRQDKTTGEYQDAYPREPDGGPSARYAKPLSFFNGRFGGQENDVCATLATFFPL